MARVRRRAPTSIRQARARKVGSVRSRTRTQSRTPTPKPRVVRVQAPRPRIKSIKSSSRRVRKPVRVQRASRGGTGSFAIRRKAQAKALRNPIKNFVATSIGSVRGAGKATRQLIDVEIEDFNIRTKRKGTEVEFPTTSKFIDFFGAEIGN